MIPLKSESVLAYLALNFDVSAISPIRYVAEEMRQNPNWSRAVEVPGFNDWLKEFNARMIEVGTILEQAPTLAEAKSEKQKTLSRAIRKLTVATTHLISLMPKQQ